LSIGFFDFLSEKNIIIIEWYENIEDFFDESTVKIKIEKTECDNSRKILLFLTKKSKIKNK
jgi:tRNA A37 threonylcarbamoyladenosine biosynthesis protein TsaE